MKKVITMLLVLIMLFSFSFFSFAGITKEKTVKENAALKFSKRFGINYQNSPTPPVVSGDSLIVVSGNRLFKLNKENGDVLATAEMSGSNIYALVSPVCVEGKIIVQLDGGIVEAFDYETLKPLWIYKNSLGGQALCPITYSYGYIYTGFWVGETEKASYVCLSVKDENKNKSDEIKKARWTYNAKGGFYLAGSAINGNYVIFGKDDGKKGNDGNSKIISLNKTTGKTSSYLNVKGDIRSSAVYDKGTNSFYVSSKAGYIYKFAMDSAGKLSMKNNYKVSGSITATPVIYGGRLYVGCFNNGSGEFLVLNAKNMKKIYLDKMSGYPQAEALVSDGYTNDTGKVYIYLTSNVKPGGITLFEDSKNQKTPIKTELFVPEKEMSEYCISTITADSDGTLYYKNDSGYIFAVGEKKNTNLIKTIMDIISKFLKEMIK